jgi:hypothetical protein
MLNWPSESRVPGTLGIDLPSPLLFKKEGVLEPRKVADAPALSLDCFLSFIPPVVVTTLRWSAEMRLADDCCNAVPASIGDVLEGLPPARGG